MEETLSSLLCDLIVDLIYDDSNHESTLHKNLIDEFCKYEHITLSIYRGLCATAQYMLYNVIVEMYRNNLPLLNENSYVRTVSSKFDNIKLAMKQLKSLQLMIPYDNNGIYLVNEYFCKNLMNYLFNYGNIKFDNNENTPKPCIHDTNQLLDKGRDVNFLRNYSQTRWNSILNFITQNNANKFYNSDTENKVLCTTTQDIFQVLIYSNIIITKNNNTLTNSDSDHDDIHHCSFEITSEGFNFLLLPIHDQIRFYMSHYLRYVYYNSSNFCDDNNTINNKDNIDILISLISFLCMIERHQEGEPFELSTTYLTVHSNHIRHFREIGLIYRKNSSSKLITFTNLALESFSHRSTKKDDSQYDPSSIIILETNLRLYLYNPTTLRVALISLFSEILVNFPNMCVARITRESMQHAFELGIASHQIITFIYNNMKNISDWKTHLHQILPPCNDWTTKFNSESFNNDYSSVGENSCLKWIKTKSSHKNYSNILPPTVIDQIIIWEEERHRLKHSFGLLLDRFSDEITYKNVINTINVTDKSQLLYNHEKDRVIIISTDNEELVSKLS